MSKRRKSDAPKAEAAGTGTAIPPAEAGNGDGTPDSKPAPRAKARKKAANAAAGAKARKSPAPKTKPTKKPTTKSKAKAKPDETASTTGAQDAGRGEGAAPQDKEPDVASAGTPAADAPRVLQRMPMAVRWNDLDAFNHVNNARYLTYLEEARLRWMLGLPGLGLDDDVAPVVAAAHVNYRRPIEWPGEVDIELFVERLGNTSVSLGHRIVAARDPGILYCDGHVVLVWIDRTTGRAAPLPPGVRETCSG